MYRRLSFLFIFLLFTQLFISTNAIAEPESSDYMTWNDYVRKRLGCDTEAFRTCENFEFGKPIYFSTYFNCVWSGNNCMSIISYSAISNDPYALLEKVSNTLNQVYKRKKGLIGVQKFIPRELTNDGLKYDIQSYDRKFFHDEIIYRIPILVCLDYNEKYGCPNSSLIMNNKKTIM